MTTIRTEDGSKQGETKDKKLSYRSILTKVLLLAMILTACMPANASVEPGGDSVGVGTVEPIKDGGTAPQFAAACEKLAQISLEPGMLVMLHQNILDICTRNMDGVVPVLSVVYLNADLPYTVPSYVPAYEILPNYYTTELPREINWENFDTAVAMKILLESPHDSISPLDNEMGSCIPIGSIDGFRQYVCQKLNLGDRGKLEPGYTPPTIVWGRGQLASAY